MTDARWLKIAENPRLLPYFRFRDDLYKSERSACWRLHCRENQMSLIARFVRDETGATAIEYGLIAAGISVAIIGVVTTLGGKLVTTFTSVQSALK
jgi:pilus assembly protein Flp/PilA